MKRYIFIILAALMLFSCTHRKIVISDVNATGLKASSTGAVASYEKKQGGFQSPL